jgi:hypothetical protein
LNKPKEIKLFGLRVKEKLKIDSKCIHQNAEENVPLWTLNSSEVTISLSNLKMSSNSS